MSAHLTRFVLPLLLGLLAAGCNTGSPGPGQRKFSAGPPAGGVAALRIVALDDAAPVFGQGLGVTVLVSDPDLQTPRLLMDSGRGLIDTNLAPAVASPEQLFFTVAAPPGARLQVQGARGGAPTVSNVAVVGATPSPTAITILSPAGRLDPFLPPPVVAPPAEATWAAPQADRFLVALYRLDVLAQSAMVSGRAYHLERLVEVPGTTPRLAFDDPGLASYFRGGSALGGGRLPAGTWGLLVYGLDASSWAAAASSNGVFLFEFEVR
ncbi:MAG: hypothetical protein M9894_21750 [Planctomycetes bacterium]|nr:hypothetical protein [Planctomycetota bacterium]